MKKLLPYLLGIIILVAAIVLIVTDSTDQQRRLDERITFRKKDKIPYGTYVAFESLKHIFPRAIISSNEKEPGAWDSLSNYDINQALVIISPVFYADEFEMKKLIRFIEKGNDVFISSAIVSEEAQTILNCSISYLDIYDLFSGTPLEKDTLRVSLSNPPFERSHKYMYPGMRLACNFFKLDTTVSTILGKGNEDDPNFIHLKAGQGNLYIHLAPMVFTNYFLLRDKNMNYYEDILSVISNRTKTLVWDEYYLYKRQPFGRNTRSRNGWMATLFRYPALKWGLLTAIFTLILFVLLEMRRKQRIIPVITRPRNDSLDFVKTIGRLYYDKGDHKNLCRKMSAYFLEHVRNRYKLPTSELDDDFIQNLQFKTGMNVSEIQGIVYFIRDMEKAEGISDRQLAYFHKQLESFYSKA
ncbi:MAG: DUF4350 domain-containing protein [Chitinophagales bacterium]